MARSRRITQNEVPPDDWTPTQAVPDPIINSPYQEPSEYWSYQDGRPIKVPGRRPAMYWYKSKKLAGGQAEIFAEEERDELPLVNRLRTDVKRWRDSGYRGATGVTKDLLSHWRRRDAPRPLFFCQLEAVETIIYLLEIAIPGRLSNTRFRNFEVDADTVDRLLRGEMPDFGGEVSEDFFPRLIDPSAENGLLPLRRMGCKMATGSGKTVVMAMLITWGFCNRGRNPSSTSFPSGVLVCAPNLTVKQRLQVLRPEDPLNFYDEFDIVPIRYRSFMGAGKVLVTNWHVFAPKSEHDEDGKTYRVVDKGAETPQALALDRLRDLATRAPMLVLNDEGHHCWRPNPTKRADEWEAEAEKGLTRDEKDTLREEAEEARVWLAGLDKVNNAGLIGEGQPCVLAAVDLSATPFYLSSSGYPEGSPFPWLVSDFGLVDAIECGIVKVPRLPVRDDAGTTDDIGRPDPKYYRLWEHLKGSMRPVDKVGRRLKPGAVYREAQGALLTLAAQWKSQFEEVTASDVGGTAIPPVMIVVCDSTETAQVFFEKISGERQVEGDGGGVRTVFGSSEILPEFANTESTRHTVRIDSKLLAKIETGEGQSRDEAARALREVIDTVGQRGGPGEHVRCVVSVSMLTEGWSANNVTHILGVRAFGSQLLCEQVVGRGLRRMSYVPDPETGLLSPEYVDVYGIPFSLIPFKGKAKENVGPDPVYHHIFSVPERASLEIRAPVVESYTYGLRSSGITCDVDALEPLIVSDEPSRVYLAPTRGYYDEPSPLAAQDFVEQDRTGYYESVRLQQILFRITGQIVDDLVQGASVAGDSRRFGQLARHQVFPDILEIVQQYVSRRVEFAKGVDPRELGLEKYATLLRERIRDGALPAAAAEGAPLLPVINSFQPFVSTADVNYRTTRPVVRLEKSHLNLAMIQSGWERDAIDILEELDFVEAYTPNDRNVGLAVPYEYQGQPHQYEPDFVVRLRGGKLLMLEIKGRKGEIFAKDQVLEKNAAARKWVAAVNNSRRFGTWDYEICRDLQKLRGKLGSHVEGAAVVLPFRIVRPNPGDQFRSCVPLTSLRAAAGQWSEEQTSLDPAEWATEWITWDDAPVFSEGMFVARVHGSSMEPLVPDGSYCLFGPPPAGSRQGRKLLVWHSGIDDPHTGGQFTLKVYTSEKRAEDDGSWAHTRVVLKPLNPAYEPVVLTPKEETDVRVVAELVCTVGKDRG